jgi:hypothetical protein
VSSSDDWLRLMQEQVDRLHDLQQDLDRQRALLEQSDRLRDLQAEWARQAERDRQHGLRIDEERQREWDRQQALEREWDRLRDLHRQMEQADSDERQRVFGLGYPATAGSQPSDPEQPELRGQLDRLQELQEDWDRDRGREWGTSTTQFGARDIEAEADRLQDLQARTDARQQVREQERQREAQEQERQREAQEQEQIRQLADLQQAREYPITALREYLRDPDNRRTSADEPMLHYMALDRLWEKSLQLAEGNMLLALVLAQEAVRSAQQSGESRTEYLARLEGIPSRAFGSDKPYAGVDKPQHFFAVAAEAYAAAMKQRDPSYGEDMAKSLGRAYEVGDAMKGVWHGVESALFGTPARPTGGYDDGDIHADDRGAKFGAALAAAALDDGPVPSIVQFLGGPQGFER